MTNRERALPAPHPMPSLSDTASRPGAWKPRMWRVARRILAVFGVLTAVGSLIALIDRSVTATSQVVVILACCVPILTLTSLIGTAVTAAIRSWVLLAINGVLALVLVTLQIPAYASDGAKLDPNRTIRILSGNLRLGLASSDDIVELARKDDAQVVALQELTPEAVLRLKASGLDALFPYSIVSAGPTATGVGLWSRTPISQATPHYGFGFHLVSAVINVGSADPVTVFSTHMTAPWPQSPAAWARDLTKLGELLNTTSGPVIDAGDFNATTDNAQFRSLLLASHTEDAADESGSAPTFSYPADMSMMPPLIAIDHVLVRTVAAHSVKTVSLPGSDHRGLLSVVGFRA